MTTLVTYSATFALGLLHAFEPGHGKSILTAFSLRRISFKVLSSLILSLFTSHFLVLSLFALGLQTLSNAEVLEEYSHVLQFLAPALVIAFGGYLLLNALKHKKTNSGCSCGKDHSKNEISNAKTASMTGFVAGLMPCPTAIAPLIISGVNGFNSTITHVLVYVLGMTLALFSFTAFLFLMKSLFQNHVKQFEGKLNLNLISALVMIGIGFGYLIMNIISSDAHFHS